jgi:cytochrome P450
MKCPMSLADVDLFSPGAQEHWYEAYPILHAEAPVHRIPGEGTTPDTDGFILSKYEDIMFVVQNPARFPAFLSEKPKPDVNGNIPGLNAMQVAILSLRPNMDLWRAHKRELTEPWVGGSGARRHTEMVTKVVDGLIEQWIDRGEVDFVNAFARPLPQIVMANVLGFPHADIPQLEIWGGAMVKPFVYGRGHRNILTQEEIDEQMKVLDGFGDYVSAQVADKRKNPKNDMTTFLTQVTYQALGRKLTDTEIVGVVYAMVIGGLETTQYAIAEEAQLLCEDPDLFKTIKADRSKIRNFCEEALRLRSPTQGLSTRYTIQDEEFQGVKVPKGSIVHMRWAAANRDPSAYECPNDVVLDRKGITRHLTFSQGPRSCPGSGLSRLEQTIAWNRLLDRIDSLDYAPNNNFNHQPGIMLGIHALNLKFTKAA